MKVVRHLLALGLTALFLTVAHEASATSNFPGAVASHLAASSSPACTVCHQNSQGGKGTVTQPFGLAMRDRGVVAYDVNSLNGALDKMASDKVDSDGDGTDDVDELKRGTDPNVPNLPDGGVDPNAQGPVSEQPGYGCSTRPFSPATSLQERGGEAGMALVLLAALSALRSRRRKPA